MYEYNELDVLVNEAIANAVDAFREHSVKPGKIDITFTKKDSKVGYLTFHNNAPPMTEKQFYGESGYHKVSFSCETKRSGNRICGCWCKTFPCIKTGWSKSLQLLEREKMISWHQKCIEFRMM